MFIIRHNKINKFKLKFAKNVMLRLYAIIDDKLFLSPTDLNKYLSCNHLIYFEIRRFRGETFQEQVSEITMSYLVAQKGTLL